MTLDRLTCDTTITTVIVDGEQVPLDMGREKRLFRRIYARPCICGISAALNAGPRRDVPTPTTSCTGLTTAKHHWATGACCARRVTPMSTMTAGMW